jgi:hypothetical protein
MKELEKLVRDKVLYTGRLIDSEKNLPEVKLLKVGTADLVFSKDG